MIISLLPCIIFQSKKNTILSLACSILILMKIERDWIGLIFRMTKRWDFCQWYSIRILFLVMLLVWLLKQAERLVYMQKIIKFLASYFSLRNNKHQKFWIYEEINITPNFFIWLIFWFFIHMSTHLTLYQTAYFRKAQNHVVLRVAKVKREFSVIKWTLEEPLQ